MRVFTAGLHDFSRNSFRDLMVERRQRLDRPRSGLPLLIAQNIKTLKDRCSFGSPDVRKKPIILPCDLSFSWEEAIGAIIEPQPRQKQKQRGSKGGGRGGGRTRPPWTPMTPSFAIGLWWSSSSCCYWCGIFSLTHSQIPVSVQGQNYSHFCVIREVSEKKGSLRSFRKASDTWQWHDTKWH